MHVEMIERKSGAPLPPCDERGCPHHAVYEIHVAIFGIKLCKECMKKLISSCNKLIS